MEDMKKRRIGPSFLVCLLLAGSIGLVVVALRVDEWVTFCGSPMCAEACGKVGYESASFPACGEIPAVEVDSVGDLWPIFPAENNFGGYFDRFVGNTTPSTCEQVNSVSWGAFFSTNVWSYQAAEDLKSSDSWLTEVSSASRKLAQKQFRGLDNALATFWSSRILKAALQLDTSFKNVLSAIGLLFNAVEAASERVDSGFSLASGLWSIENTMLNTTASTLVVVQEATLAEVFFGSLDFQSANVAEVFQAFVEQDDSQNILQSLASIDQVNLAIQVGERLPELVRSCSNGNSQTQAMFSDVTVNTEDLVLTPSLTCLARVLEPSLGDLTANMAALALCDESSVKDCQVNSSSRRLPEQLNSASKLCQLAILQEEFQGEVTNQVDVERCSGVDMVKIVLNLARAGTANSTLPTLPHSLSRVVRVYGPLSNGTAEELAIPPPHLLHLEECARKALPYASEENRSNSCQASFSNPKLLQNPAMSISEANQALLEAEQLPESTSSLSGLCTSVQFLLTLSLRDGQVFFYDPFATCLYWQDLGILGLYRAYFEQAANDVSKTDEEREVLRKASQYSNVLFSFLFPAVCNGRSDCMKKLAAKDPRVITAISTEFPLGEQETVKAIEMFYDSVPDYQKCLEVENRVEAFLSTRALFTASLVLLSLCLAVTAWSMYTLKYAPVLYLTFAMQIASGALLFFALSKIETEASRFPLEIQSGDSFGFIRPAAILALVSAVATLFAIYVNLKLSTQKNIMTTAVSVDDNKAP